MDRTGLMVLVIVRLWPALHIKAIHAEEHLDIKAGFDDV